MMVVVIKDDIKQTQLVLQVPARLTNGEESSVRTLVRAAYEKVQSDKEWNYSQIADELVKQGFSRVEFVDWEE